MNSSGNSNTVLRQIAKLVDFVKVHIFAMCVALGFIGIMAVLLMTLWVVVFNKANIDHNKEMLMNECLKNDKDDNE